MLKNKNFNFALIVFAITLTVLFALVEYYPSDSVSDSEIETTEKAFIKESLADSSQ
ncbi:MAG: hypothetical protein HKN00_01105 [Flavobacteriaceae bacterium]|nr:hypothetical protein [Bacteroidia bacterium]NNF73754.1 hypothetical protein [Flavobacteriaceae bacterium]NNK73445.1 hypothetical protein [Flavobacteriaceae bacterium]